MSHQEIESELEVLYQTFKALVPTYVRVRRNDGPGASKTDSKDLQGTQRSIRRPRKAVKLVTAKEILLVHKAIMAFTGSSPAIMPETEGKLSFAADFLRYPPYIRRRLGTVFDSAAYLLDYIIRNHAFYDGNKRTATAVAAFSLDINGYKLVAAAREIVAMAIAVDLGIITVQELATWLRRHCRPIRARSSP